MAKSEKKLLNFVQRKNQTLFSVTYFYRFFFSETLLFSSINPKNDIVIQQKFYSFFLNAAPEYDRSRIFDIRPKQKFLF